MFSIVCALGLVYWLARIYIGYYYNKKAAFASGMPYICVPVNTWSPLWQVLGPVFMRFCGWLPFHLGNWVQDVRPAWVLKNELHAKYGPVFMVVTPWSKGVHVTDPDAVVDLVTRRTKFPKPSHLYKLIDVYGKNVITTDGHEWLRYRRITGPPFSEKNNILVWTSALDQVDQMILNLRTLPRAPGTRFNSPGWVLDHVQRDMRTIALHVISAAAFGVDLPFLQADASAEGTNDIWKQQESDDLGPVPAQSHTLTFSQSIRTLLQHLFLVLLFPKFLLRVVPLQSWRLASSAYSEFRDYTFLLTQRAKRLGAADGERVNLLHALVSQGRDNASPDSLSDDEVLAHMFTYILAGHESTGNTLSYAIVNLAVHQEAQDWFLAQLDEQLKACDAGADRKWDYSTSHGSLAAVICLMNESLRLYPACAAVPKWTADAPATLHSNGHKYIVPPRTPVVINTIAIHRDPELWGDDVLEFRPQRWIENPPRKGQFMGFSEGARACLGKKFAQVEFVAVIATLFSRFRVELDCVPGESAEEVRKRAVATLDGSTILANLGMTKEVPIRFVERA